MGGRDGRGGEMEEGERWERWKRERWERGKRGREGEMGEGEGWKRGRDGRGGEGEEREIQMEKEEEMEWTGGEEKILLFDSYNINIILIPKLSNSSLNQNIQTQSHQPKTFSHPPQRFCSFSPFCFYLGFMFVCLLKTTGQRERSLSCAL